MLHNLSFKKGIKTSIILDQFIFQSSCAQFRKKSSWYYMLNQNYKSEIEYLFKKIKIISIKWFLWSLIQRINERLLRAQKRYKCVCYATISLSFLSIFLKFFCKSTFFKMIKNKLTSGIWLPSFNCQTRT